MTAPPVLVEVTRRDRSGREVVESTHRAHVAVVDASGQVVAGLGDPDRLTYLRSAVKPFQAAACLQLLDDGGAGLTAPELAVAWASHRAEPRHLEAVAALLARSGTSPDDLTCPPTSGEDDPSAPAERRRFNCSGKHALFALAGAALGDRGQAVIDPDGQVQRHVLSAMDRWLLPAEAVAVDGCGAPAVALPLWGLAKGFAQLPIDQAFDRVVHAGLEHPGLVGGEGRPETSLLEAGVIAKPGAEGVFGLAVPTAQGWLGVAVKVEDGASRAAGTIAVGVTAALGGPRVAWRHPAPTGGGEPQGHVRWTASLEDLRI